jgi:hypothetical protein
MPAFLHRPVPSFDGDIMTEGIEHTANKLIGCSIHWMAVQFSGNWVEGKNNFTRWNDEGGGARAM